MSPRSLAVILGAAIAMSAFAGTADAAKKRHKRSVQASQQSYGPPRTYRQEPARMIEIAPGKWISSWGCYTDEGYGRYGTCDMREGPM